MSLYARWCLALAVLVVDAAAFSVPLTGFLAAYVIVARPPWFLRLIASLYRIEPAGTLKEKPRSMEEHE